MPPRSGTPAKGKPTGRRTPTRSQSRIPSTSPSTVSLPPPLPPLPPPLPPVSQKNEQLSKTNPYALLAEEWKTRDRATDPVFSSKKILRRIELQIENSIQDYEHCPVEYFPTVAEKFGLTRWIPEKLAPVKSRGPVCIVDGKTNTICHRPCLPAFMYTRMENITCKTAEQKRHYPTLLWRWEFGKTGVLQPLTCWSCYSQVDSHCELKSLAIKPIDPSFLSKLNSSAATTKVAPATESASRSHNPPVDRIIIRTRTSTEAGLESPTPKRPSRGNSTLPLADISDTNVLANDPSPPHHAPEASLPLSLPLSDEVSAVTLPETQAPFADPPAEPAQDPPKLRLWRQYRLKARSAEPQTHLSTSKPFEAPLLPPLPPPPPPPPSQQQAPAQPQSQPPHPSQSPLPTSFASQNPPVLVPQSSPQTDSNESAAAEIVVQPTTRSSTLAALRAEAEEPFSAAVKTARHQLQVATETQERSISSFNRLFEFCEEIAGEAQRDRAAIEVVRAERDKLRQSHRTLDIRLIHSSQLVSKKTEEVKSLSSKLDFLQTQYERLQREQAAIEQRIEEAVMEREKALMERDTARLRADELVEVTNQALREKVDAQTGQQQAEAAMDDAEGEVMQLSKQLEESQVTVASLHAQLLSANTKLEGFKIAPTQASPTALIREHSTHSPADTPSTSLPPHSSSNKQCISPSVPIATVTTATPPITAIPLVPTADEAQSDLPQVDNTTSNVGDAGKEGEQILPIGTGDSVQTGEQEAESMTQTIPPSTLDV
ncbi:hypothetical protein TREMEDRAFT_58491 [Tremella mesenterica DSM 1558]|uniref:uncharacterized protein n=1 Tax=Tremella mesenterica (strain ATCC 24925 / CBS 8224 / DSM 1558 / NBRC 9311 / NRRL Y-6157 / RJB 2259-6 / UBC 559-6) TaxID=578456 RepID=UPI0003F496C9|nr:uncharacterized protein TREMEDRAFT_58491 [Tremella mesenterica DSM 1558]EIW72328.1 hypothetical protein TREMEDRAFT_58491 [Tremella mesenterica DSM 1558]